MASRNGARQQPSQDEDEESAGKRLEDVERDFEALTLDNVLQRIQALEKENQRQKEQYALEKEQSDKRIQALEKENQALRASQEKTDIVNKMRLGVFDDLSSGSVDLPSAPAVLGKITCVAFQECALERLSDRCVAVKASAYKDGKRGNPGPSNEKRFDLKGREVKSSAIQASHLIPHSYLCRTDWAAILQHTLPEETLKSKDVVEKILFGCFDEDNKYMPGMAENPYNFINLVAQQAHLDQKAAIMVLPLLCPQQQCEWSGEGYQAILICANQEVYDETVLRLETEAIGKNKSGRHDQVSEAQVGEKSRLKEICEPMREDYLIPSIFPGDMEKLHQALEYIEILLKDVAAIQCGQELSLEELLQNAGISTKSAREKLRAEKMVKTFKGLESTTEEIVCFRLIRFKGSSPEEAEVHLHQAPHPLLLSLRSMNAITNHCYGDLANNVTRLLLMSCYSSLDEGMDFDCEHCLRNAFGLEYDEEAKYEFRKQSGGITVFGRKVLWVWYKRIIQNDSRFGDLRCEYCSKGPVWWLR
ncbi:hypothetical protein GUITHDRAFT_114020 [Guillardia theta CCMP2712]|uniref:Uncharacterized protein n=1 Tax=Guillardia theta (strain CCMP2712) TaxID=905079 RepID=L1IU87_GUITC|nr:hypothetical protein GUITHDRAFT_114020 [Guillardia theta CCMP2712]EKX39773.1 hypothetical protein GUITHDRAFT_114020 [Guillardia theta CCMP2712]|eukprot:XP_005826753.1 hypothetical protein GUITHDRAFT_114020 [Guillardia theta CCMP2712]